MQAFVATMAKHYAGIELFARILFGKALALMQLSGDQMMKAQRNSALTQNARPMFYSTVQTV